ncbi:MAG: glycoside hydrolase family 127 protein [Coriobacteriia bacterium]|nr:glycoside hydrolase family 127 protein [Coriobacteriia bacterium]
MKKVLILGVAVVAVFALTACSKIKPIEANYECKPATNISMNYTGFYKNLMDFTKQTQLLNKDMWKQFVDVFRTKEDAEKSAWRCEYWGKTMRGAVLCYKYDQSDELYNVLEETVRDLLSAQDENGAFTTYSSGHEFKGWDIWGRKYILTSLLSFMDICKDQALKDQIKTAVCKHADCIIANIGHESNKTEITHASNNWLGVNSASILEPIVNLYEVTGDNKYIDFAKYIVDTGGIRTEDGNLIDICSNTDRMPYQYPEAKAYETMSFFEGVYRFALVTNNDYLKATALKFFDDVDITEVTVVGNAGYDEEQFNNGSKMQTVEPERFGQETCVAVTWMRIQDLLYKTTGNIKYYEGLKKSGVNAFLSTVNYYNQGAHDLEHMGPDPLVYLPFDSYAPLGGGKHGVAAGGFQYFMHPLNPQLKYYGCCACISSAAVGLMSLDTVSEINNNIRLNDYYAGTIKTPDTSFNIDGDFIANGEVNIKVNSSSDKKLELLIPSSIGDKTTLTIDGVKYPALAGTVTTSDKPLKDIKEIVFKTRHVIKKTVVNDKVSLSYGDIVLGIDTEANPGINLTSISINDLDIKNFTVLPLQEDDLVRLSVPYKGGKLVLKGYNSCGKHWADKDSNLTVFVNK